MANEIDYFRALQILALDSTESGDTEAFYRKVARWYSKTFSTPLSDVDSIPVEKLFLTYYEDTFEALYNGSEEDQKQYEIFRGKILAGTVGKTEEAEDDDWAAQEIAKIKEEEAKKGNKVPKIDVKQIIDNASKKVAQEMKMADHLADLKGDHNSPNIVKEEINLDGVRLLGEDPSMPLD